MKPLVFTLRSEPVERLDLSALTPARLSDLSSAAIEKLAIGTTQRPLRVGDVFRLRDGDRSVIRFSGGSSRFDRIAMAMESGVIEVDGMVGREAGCGMRGGALTISGAAGDYAASGARGGAIEIGGDCGDFLGAPLVGEMEGINGGVVIVRGRAGHRACDRMRRGLVAVEKGAGEYAGSRMIAGTLVVAGPVGGFPGTMMRRGTIIMPALPEIAPTFLDCGATPLGFTALYATSLAARSPRAARLLRRALRRFGGDTATLGKGELLVPA
ncbi:MAG: formylmethanofuran dehydrogenase subunit C [Hyphomicrobiales bacterium]|nr:formylmethanofuran dehydrogenase subunit C [Hyphomicrobiales bacterium]